MKTSTRGIGLAHLPVLAMLLLCGLALALASSTPVSACGCGATTPPPPSGSPGDPPCWGGKHGGKGGGGCGGKGGSPQPVINTFNGNLHIEDMPVYYEGPPGAAPFTIGFDSQSTRSSTLGDRWTHSYDTSIIDDAPYGLYVIYGNGRESYFTGTDPYTDEAGNFDSLVKTWSGTTWTGWRLTKPSNEKYAFDTAGQMTKYTNADGLNWTLTYSSGLLTTITDPKSRQTTLQYTSGLLTRVTVPGGLYATFQYDTYTPKRLWKITDAEGYTYTLGYSGTRVTSVTDPSGSQVWYTYGTFNNKAVVSATGITNVSGSTIGYSYIAQTNGQLYTDITEQKDGLDRVTRQIHEFTDDAATGRYYGTLLSTVTDVGGVAATEAWTYDSKFRMATHRDSYQTESGGKVHTHRYYYTDPANPDKVTKYIDPENYDSSLGSNSPSYRYVYDTRGNKTQETTPENRVTNYTYVSGTDRLASVIVHDQDVSGTPVDWATSYTYWTSTYGYQLKTVTDARGNVTTYYYDSNCYLDYIDLPGGNVPPAKDVDYTCNAMGDVTAITDGNGSTTSYQCDGIHRQTQITYPDIGAGQKTKTTDWTCCGIDQVTDENGRTTKYEYEQYTNRLKKVHEDYYGLNYVTEYGYDEVGNLLTEKNARGKTTSYTYDDADRKTRADYPDSTYETWTYRDDGRVYQHRDGRGRVTTYRYDADDRLAGSGSYVAINYPNDTDVKIARDKDGLVTTTIDASGTTTSVYYPSQWLKTATVSAGASKTVTYQYNGMGLVSRLTAPDGGNFDYTYTARNQLDTITNPNSVTVSFDYDNGGRRTSVNRPNSVILYGYNARDWITSVRNRTGTSDEIVRYDALYSYQDGSLWDHTGNPLKRVENFGGNDYTTTLRYDNVYRETEETKRDYQSNVVYAVGYGYDAVGNRTSMTRDGTGYTYVYDDNNKLTSISSGGNTAAFTYDGSGNMTYVDGLLYPTRSMTYDDESRLSSVNFNGYTDTYTYNWQGRRTRAYLSGTYYRYIYNGERVLEELNDSGGVLARYTTENDSYYGPLLHLQRATGESRFPLYDEIGSARGLIDAGGTVTDTYDMDTFGQPVATTGSTPNPYRYGAAWGYITDPSGLLQLGARYYWPEVGRFVQQDPIGRPPRLRVYSRDRALALLHHAGWMSAAGPENLFSAGASGLPSRSPYPYATSNPLAYIDPDGECWIQVTAVVVLVAFVVYEYVAPWFGDHEPAVHGPEGNPAPYCPPLREPVRRLPPGPGPRPGGR